MQIDQALLNIIFNTLYSNLKPEVKDRKVMDLWTEYASIDGNSNILSYDELDMLIKDNLEKDYIKHLIPLFTKNDPTYKNGILLNTVKHLIKCYSRNEDLLELTVKDAIPAWKKGIIYESERYKWHTEWLEMIYEKKNLPEKYQGKDGYELFISDKDAAFEKAYNM